MGHAYFFLTHQLKSMNRLLLLVVLLWGRMALGQVQSTLSQADRQFDRLSFSKAAELYEEALGKTNNLTEAQRRSALVQLAYSYRQLNDMKNAERAYSNLLVNGELPADLSQHYLYYAQALASNGKYEAAQKAYGRYEATQGKPSGDSVLSELHKAIDSRSEGTYILEFLKLNTRQPEFSPIPYGDGLVYVATAKTGGFLGGKRLLDLYYQPDIKMGQSSGSRGTGSFFQRPLGRDAYTATTANDSRTVGFYGGNNVAAGLGYGDVLVSETERFGKSLNTRYHEGPATFTSDGSRIIFTRNNYNEGQARRSTDGVNKLKLYTATQINGTWSEATELPFNSDEFSTGHPALSADNKRLYFASDRPGGFGGSDIYVSFWKDKNWSEPVNLGADVNSKGNELFPFIDERGTLYLASDGHEGLGKLDIFTAQLSSDGKKGYKISNLGEPINSAADDFGITTDGQRNKGYFSSNRKNGGADDDIYRFTRQGPVHPCRELTLIVFDAQSRMPLPDVTVRVTGPDTLNGKLLKTDEKGLLRFCLDNNSDVQFLTNHAGYLENHIGFSSKNLVDNQPVRLDIPLMKPVVATTTELAINGRVLTQKDREPVVGATVILINECDKSRQEAVSADNGLYSFVAMPGCAYRLEAKKEGMGTAGSFITKEGKGDTDLLMFRKGDVVRIDNIYYDRNKATIRPDAARELDKMVELMNRYPSMRIELRSHTDSRASASYNMTLSDKRAKAVVRYLRLKGIGAKRMVAKGFGESEPVNKCVDGVTCTEEEYQENRRTEFKILELN